MTRVLYPGSFDPLHLGHLEIIEVAAALFDEVVVAALKNPQKASEFFPLEVRESIIHESTAHLTNVSVMNSDGLVVDLARSISADFIVKGLRTVSDFEAEMQMAQMNFAVSGVRTVFLPATSQYSFIASKYVRDIARLGGDVTSTVPPAVAKRIQERYGR